MEESKPSVTKFFELDKMSPVVVYGILSAISLLTIYNTKTNLEKMDDIVSSNVLDVYLWYEVVFIIFGGLMLLCFGQNGEKSLCCIALFIPTILIALKLIIIFIGVNGISKKIPSDKFMGLPVMHEQPHRPTVSDLNNKLAIDTKRLNMNMPPSDNSDGFNAPLSKGQYMNSGGLDSGMHAPLGMNDMSGFGAY